MEEYWWSARRVALSLLPAGAELPEPLPEQFRQLRPRVLHGWEMGVLAASIAGWAEPASAFADDYSAALAASLKRLGWTPQQLTTALDAVRCGAIADDRAAWLALHRPYPWMLAALQRLDAALEAVRATPGLESVVCCLVSWGYLLPEDGEALPPGLALLRPEQLEQPLAQWP